MSDIPKDLIAESIKEILKRAKIARETQDSDFRDGQMLAYNEVLSILKTDLTPYDPKELGLDVDLDKELL